MSRLIVWSNYFVLFSFLVFCFVPGRSVAESTPGPIVVSEVNWAGSSISTADEWLELTNLSDGTIDLAGWSIWTVIGEPKQLVGISAGSIGSHGTFLIANNGPDYQFSLGTSSLATVPDVVDSSLSLSNSALQLELRNGSGQVIDHVGDGGKPFFGSTSPVASMERIFSPIGSGTSASSWRTAITREHLDGDSTQQGTPTASGIAATPPQSTTQPSPVTASNQTFSVVRSTIRAVVEGRVAGTLQLEGTIAVPEQLYTSRTVIVSDGPWSAELSLPTTTTLHLEQGDQVTVIAKVSRGSTPKVLVGADGDVVKHGHERVDPLTLDAIDHPMLFQLLKITGIAHPARGVVELVSKGRTFRITRRQGISLPSIQNQDAVTVTGLIVSLDPLDIRTLSSEDVVVASTSRVVVSAPAAISGASEGTSPSDRTTELHVDDSHSTTTQTDSGTDVAVANQIPTNSGLRPTGQASVLEPTVFGAYSGRAQTPLERVSLSVALVSACAILTLLGDSLWIRLKYRQ